MGCRSSRQCGPVVQRRLAEVESGGVLVGSHDLFMSLGRRFLCRGDEKLGPFILGLMVRPLGLAIKTGTDLVAHRSGCPDTT